EGRCGTGVPRDRRGRRLSAGDRDVAPGPGPGPPPLGPGAAGTGARHRRGAVQGARRPMNCRAMRDRVQAYADDELGVEGACEVEPAPAGCSACRAASESGGAFRHMAGALYRQQAPPDLERRIAARLRSRRWPLLASGIAAAAVIAGLAGLLTRGSEAAL